MPDTFVERSELKFVSKIVNRKYPVRVPEYLDLHQWWDDWETARFDSMEKNLKKGMLFFDVGAFDGWQDVIISRFVGGGRNMVLIEPVEENWANIRATWEDNLVELPYATCYGFMAADSDQSMDATEIVRHGWPTKPDYSKVISVTKFKLLNEHRDTTPWIQFDNLATLIGLPNAINVDVEGGELEVLRSAQWVLTQGRPLVWVAIHPEFMKDRYNQKPEDIHKFMHSLGYNAEFLGSDHEEHFLFRKAE